MAKLKTGTTINGNTAWHAGNDGSGSGLDADTLDTKHASDFVAVTGDTMTGTLTIDTGAGSEDALVIKGTAPTINLLDDTSGQDDFYIHINSNNFYILTDRDGANQTGTGWESPHPLQLEADTNIGYVFGQRIFNELYHPNADKWTTARTITLGGDLSGSVSLDGSANVTLSAQVSNNSHEHRNLDAVDDRDIAPEDLNYGDDFRIFFAEKSQIEGGTNAANYQDLIVLNSYTDSTGGDANALAFDKSEKKIYHYQADQAATNWGTPETIAYVSDIPTNNNQLTNGAGYTTNTGTVTNVTVGTGLDVSNGTTTPSITLDLSELTDMTADVSGLADELILLDAGAERRKLISEIKLSQFNNDAGWASGDITNLTAGGGLTGGGSSGSVTISHADTSSQASVNNSGSTFIQDITLDTYGHITGITSATASGGSTGTLDWSQLGSVTVPYSTSTTSMSISPSNGLDSIIAIEVQVFSNASPATWTGPLDALSASSTYKAGIWAGSTQYANFYRNSTGTSITFSGAPSANIYNARVYEIKVV